MSTTVELTLPAEWLVAGAAFVQGTWTGKVVADGGGCYRIRQKPEKAMLQVKTLISKVQFVEPRSQLTFEAGGHVIRAFEECPRGLVELNFKRSAMSTQFSVSNPPVGQVWAEVVDAFA